MNNAKLIECILLIAVGGEFIGHGVFALQGKKAWIEWLAICGKVLIKIRNSDFRQKKFGF